MTNDLHGDDYARGAAHDFAVNVSADALAPWLRHAIALGVERIGRYPDDTAATAAVALRHHRDPHDALVLNGAAEAFTLLAHALRPRHAVVVHPSFAEPERALRGAGLRPDRVVLAEPFALDPGTVPADADLVVVGNPTNPTGVLHGHELLAGLCRTGRTTVVDEAFMDFVPGQVESLAAHADLPGLVVIRSLTKVLGVPGVRAGYLLAEASDAHRLRQAAPRWSVNAIALAVIEAAAEHPEHIERQAAITAERRAALADRLRRIPGVRPHPGNANFLLLELGDAVAVHRRLLDEHGIATRPCWPFPGLDERHLRIAVRGNPLDAAFAEALGAICARSASGRWRAPARLRR